MALQNAVQRVHLSYLPPTTLMTGNTTQLTIDAVDLLMGTEATQTAAVRTRFGRVALSIATFAAGCAAAATLYWLFGFWCLIVPVVFGALAAFIRLETPAPYLVHGLVRELAHDLSPDHHVGDQRAERE